MATQGGTQRANSTIAEYIRNLNNQARKILGNDASQVDVARFNKAIEQLTANDCARLVSSIQLKAREGRASDLPAMISLIYLVLIYLGI